MISYIMSKNFSNIVLQSPDLPLQPEVDINQVGIAQTGNPNSLSFTRLLALKGALEAVDTPPNSTTFKINSTIQATDNVNTTTITPTTVTTSNLTSTATSITSEKRINQVLNTVSTYGAVNGPLALAKDAYPTPDPASSGQIAVSTWVTRTGPTNIFWKNMCWSPQLRLFCAVAQDTTTGNKIMTSPDGITWTIQSTSNTTGTLMAVAWSPKLNLFVACGNGGALTRILKSSDGITWTSANMNGLQNFVYSAICWSPELELFVMTGNSTSSYTSVDGSNWITYGANMNFNPISICWSPELAIFVAVTNNQLNSGRLHTSTDGQSWTSRTIPTANQWLNSVCWSSELGLFVAVANSGTNNRVITSPDGITWTARTTNNNQWVSVCWAPELGLFVATAVSGTGDRIMTSPDGITWTTRASPADNEWRSICWAPEIGILAGVASSGIDNRAMTSTLVGRPPTSFNVFNSTFNNIDSNGLWSINRPYAEYLQTGNQSFSASTPTDIQLSTDGDQNGITRTSNIINFNKAGIYKIGVSMLVEESGGSGVDFYFSFTDASGVVANSGSVFRIAGNGEKTLAYAEIIYNATSSSATIKAVGYTTSAGLTLTSYASPNASIASSPAVIFTVYQLR
jgi:hypothetical protein